MTTLAERKSSQAVITAAVGVRAAGGDSTTKGGMARKASQAVFGAQGQNSSGEGYEAALAKRRVEDAFIFVHLMPPEKVCAIYGSDTEKG